MCQFTPQSKSNNLLDSQEFGCILCSICQITICWILHTNMGDRLPLKLASYMGDRLSFKLLCEYVTFESSNTIPCMLFSIFHTIIKVLIGCIYNPGATRETKNKTIPFYMVVLSKHK
jgi:hypothetical protein